MKDKEKSKPNTENIAWLVNALKGYNDIISELKVQFPRGDYYETDGKRVISDTDRDELYKFVMRLLGSLYKDINQNELNSRLHEIHDLIIETDGMKQEVMKTGRVSKNAKQWLKELEDVIEGFITIVHKDTFLIGDFLVDLNMIESKDYRHCVKLSSYICGLYDLKRQDIKPEQMPHG